MVAPLSAIFSSKTFCGLAPLALTVENILLKNLSSCELLYSKFLPLVAAALIPLAAPYTIGVIKIDSLPNLTLFNNFLPASSLPPSSVTLVNWVGPASNASPKLPISSVSTTNASPAAPPATPAVNLFTFAFLFKSFVLFKAFITFGLAKFA